MNKYQEALNIVGRWNCEVCKHEHGLKCNECSFYEQYCTLQELIDKCVFINEEWKTKNNVQDTFLIETPTDRTCLPQGVDYEQ